MSLEATNDTAKVSVLLENKETCHTYTTRKKKNNFLFLLPENSFSSITVFSQQNQYLRTDSLHCAFLSWEDLFKQWIFLRSSGFLLVFTPRLFSNFISLTRSMSTLEQYYIILSTEKKKKKTIIDSLLPQFASQKIYWALSLHPDQSCKNHLLTADISQKGSNCMNGMLHLMFSVLKEMLNVFSLKLCYPKVVCKPAKCDLLGEKKNVNYRTGETEIEMCELA